MVQVLEVVRQKASAVGAGVWLDDLPLLVASLEQEWGIAVGDAYGDSTEAFVAEATYQDGTPAVLKLLVPRSVDAAHDEITVLRLIGGEGCVRLLRENATRGALLLERLGRSLYQLALPIRRRHEILCSTAPRVWRLAPGCGLRSGGIQTRRPDGLLAEPEYDLGIIMREDPLDLLNGDPHERARWLAARTGLDAAAIWEWGVVERVSTGLLCTKVGLQPVGRQMLAVLDRVAV